MSDRAPAGSVDGDADNEDGKASRIWLISASGGEALPLYSEKLDVHTFAWAPDSSCDLLLGHVAADARPGGRSEGRVEGRRALARAVSRRCLAEARRGPGAGAGVAAPLATEVPKAAKANAEPSSKLAEGAETIAKVDLAISEIAPSPDGRAGCLRYRTNPQAH